MANSAYLCISAKPSFPDLEQDEVLLAANYAIPLLWLAIFRSKDLACFQDEEGNEADFLVTPIESAQQRFVAREAILRNDFPNIDEYIAAWHKMLHMIQQPYVKAYISEILALDDDGSTTLKQALAYFESPAENSKEALLGVTALDENPITASPGSQYFILGGKAQTWLPWTDPDEIETDEYPMTVDSPSAPSKKWWEFWK